MNKDKFYELVKENLNIVLNDDLKQKLDTFARLLIEYNKHTNITSITDLEGIYLKHFYDSLTLVKEVDLSKNITVLDVGSGGGFPGIVLAIVFPNLDVTLLDSNNKKSKFQEYAVKELSLCNVRVVNERAEIYFKKSDMYDLVVARAVADMTVLSELCIPFVKEQGMFIAMKGKNESEIDEAKYAIGVLGGKIKRINKFKLPISGDDRQIVSIFKEEKTPDEYPRVYDKILKKPLKNNQK